MEFRITFTAGDDNIATLPGRQIGWADVDAASAQSGQRLSAKIFIPEIQPLSQRQITLILNENTARQIPAFAHANVIEVWCSRNLNEFFDVVPLHRYDGKCELIYMLNEQRLLVRWLAEQCPIIW